MSALTLTSRFVGGVLACCLLCCAPAGATGSSFLVADLSTVETDGDGLRQDLGGLAAGGVVYFAAFHPLVGWEPWRSDGTAAGTRLVKDVCPGPCSSDPQALTRFGERVFFVATDGVTGRELWSTDAAGKTTSRVADLCSGPCPAFGDSPALGVWGGRLYFGASDGKTGDELWSTDGTRRGTLQVADHCPGECGSEPRLLTPAGDQLFFLSRRRLLATSDGTAPGTRDLLDACEGAFPLNCVHEFAALGEALIFKARTLGGGGNARLWRSDGTREGTAPLGAAVTDLLGVFGGELYFNSGTRLWRTDGSPEGTGAVPGTGVDPVFSALRDLRNFAVLGEEAYVLGLGEDGLAGLWATDGDGVRFVGPATSGLLDDLVATRDRLFFSVGAKQVWSSDGQQAARQVRALQSATAFVPVGGRIFFTGFGLETGLELWTSDGSGARLVRDIHRDPGSAWPHQLTPVGGRVVFTLADPEAVAGSDGSAAGTVFLPGPTATRDFLPFGPLLLYSGDRAPLPGLWQTDGTVINTVIRVPDVSAENFLLLPDGRIFFAGYTALSGLELWTTDLTEGGTRQVRDIAPGFPSFVDPPEGFSSEPRELTPIEGGIVFSASTVTEVALNVFEEDRELWFSDGTSLGTRRVADLCADCSSDPAGLVPFGPGADLVAFAATDEELGRELWATDGTAAGTRVFDLAPGPAGSDPHDLHELGGRVLFFADSGGGEALYATDGTPEGTFTVHDLAVDSLPSFVTEAATVGGTLFFALFNEATGSELWASDGTFAGTRTLEIVPGPRGSYPRSFAAADGLLLFAAADAAHGLEPWRSDGTIEGTWMVDDVEPGVLPSTPDELTAAGELVFFSGATSDAGIELRAFPREVLFEEPCPLEYQGVCLRGLSRWK